MAKAEVVEVNVPKWWSFLLRGIAVFIFGIFVLAAGIAAVAATVVEARKGEKFFLSFLVAVVCLVLAILVLARPSVGLSTIRYLIAAWAIIYGFIIVMSGFEAPKGDSNMKWMLVLTGAASIIIGIILLAVSGLGQWAIILLIGLYALAQGVLLCIVSFRMRALYKTLGMA